MMNDWNLPKMSEFGTKCAGHEGAGVIVKVGEKVTMYKVGQRAGHKPIQDVCHTCDYCKAGKETYCTAAIFTGCATNGKDVLSGIRAPDADQMVKDHTSNTSVLLNVIPRSSLMAYLMR